MPIGGAVTKPAVASQYGTSMGGSSAAKNVGVEEDIANGCLPKPVPQGKNPSTV